MLTMPGSVRKLEYDVTHTAAEEMSRNWWVPLFNGLLLLVAGVLIFSIDWSVGGLATFIGTLFIVEGAAIAISGGIDPSARRSNSVLGLLSAAAGIAVIAWPAPGLVVVAVFLGTWLIATGTTAIVGSFAARPIVANWWLWLLVGIFEVTLGVLALADPGATLAALVTVAGIWAAAIGVTEVVLSFEVKRLPHEIDKAFGVTHAHASS